MTALVDLIESTVKLEQPLGDGLRTVGTGFVVADTAPDGSPRTVLITANHVLTRMPAEQATIGLRLKEADGTWRYAPQNLKIRSPDGAPLWTHHPMQDIAAIEIPPEVAGRAIPVAYLAVKETLSDLQLEPGDEMIVLGFPLGVAANKLGFPILRSGRVASYPIAPASRFPTFLLDFSVFAGNSGGPVFVDRAWSVGEAAARPSHPTVVGVLTQQIKMDGDRLAIGNVTQAKYVIETMSLLGEDEAVVMPAATPTNTGDLVPASEARPQKTGIAAWWDWIAGNYRDLETTFRRGWIVVRDKITAWTTQAPMASPRSSRP